MNAIVENTKEEKGVEILAREKELKEALIEQAYNDDEIRTTAEWRELFPELKMKQISATFHNNGWEKSKEDQCWRLRVKEEAEKKEVEREKSLAEKVDEHWAAKEKAKKKLAGAIKPVKAANVEKITKPKKEKVEKKFHQVSEKGALKKKSSFDYCTNCKKLEEQLDSLNHQTQQLVERNLQLEEQYANLQLVLEDLTQTKPDNQQTYTSIVQQSTQKITSATTMQNIMNHLFNCPEGVLLCHFSSEGVGAGDDGSGAGQVLHANFFVEAK